MDSMHKWTDEELEKLERKLRVHYRKAGVEMEKKLSQHLLQFNADDKRLAKLLKQGRIKKKDYIAWRQRQILLTKSFKEIRDQLAKDYLNVNRQAAEMIGKKIPEVMSENRNYATFDIERKSGMDTMFTLTDKDTVDRLIKDQPNLLPKVYAAKDKAWNRRKITSAVTQGILQGESMDDVAKRLQRVTEMNRNAAIRNARTAVTGAENAGRLSGFERAEGLGIKMLKQWMATHDSRTRHSHRDLDGEEVEIKEEFGNGLMYPGDPDGDAEEVYNCFVGETMVSTDSDILHSYKHDYSGELITIKTASGVNFTCTPNHPILTPRGWIGAAFLNDGDNIIVTRIGDGVDSWGNPDVEHIHARIDTIHEFANKVGCQRTGTLSVNFHGDISTSEVEVITHKGLLWNDRDVCIGKSIYKLLFKITNKSFTCKSTFMKHLWSICLTTFGYISRRCKAFAFFSGRLAHSHIHRFRTISDRDIILTENTIDDLTADTVFGREFIDRLPGNVFVDNIIGVDRIVSDCHVYNLHTDSNYYFVNSIPQNEEKYNGIYAVAHNCRCTMIAQVEGHEIEKDIDVSDDYMDYEDWKEGLMSL